MADATGGGRALISGTAVYGIGEVLNRSITFLLLPLLTAYLSPADFGVSAMLTTLGFLLTPVFSLGLGAAMAPHYFERSDLDHRGAVIGTTLAMLVLSSALMLALAFVTAPLISTVSFQTPRYARLVVLAVGGTACSLATIPLRQCLQFERRAGASVTLSAISTISSVALTVILVIVLRRGVSGLVEAGLVGQAITFVIFAAPVMRSQRLRLDRQLAGPLLSLGLPLVPAFGAVFVLQHGTKYLLQYFRGIDDVGIYTVGLNLGLVVSVLVTAFQSAWVPFFMAFSDKQEAARTEFARIATYILFGLGSIGLLLFAVARPLVLIMTQPPFHPAWRVVGMSATAQVLNGLSIVLLPGVYFARELRFIAILQGAAAAIGLAIGALLIPLFGGPGAALTLVLGYVALVTLQFALNRFRGYVDVKYDWRRAGIFAVLYVAFAAVTLVDRRWSLGEECVAAAFAASAALVMVAAQLTASERHTLSSAARMALQWRTAA